MIKVYLIYSLSILLLFLTSTTTLAKERDYQIPFCENLGGKIEYVLDDKSRVDCLTNSNAIEVDFGKKWTEAIGQSLYYALKTGKKAGIGLIIRDKSKEYKYWLRLNTTISTYNLPIDTWMIE